MSVLAPPPSTPRLATTEPDGIDPFRLRTTQVIATVITVLLTAWFCTFGIIPAIIALMIAKHILVAILMMGLGVDKPRPRKKSN